MISKNKLILDTRTKETIYESLSKILCTSEVNVKNIIEIIDTVDDFKLHFNLDDKFYFPYVTIHHFTSRLDKDYESNFTINNLENTLLSNNSLTRFLEENNIIFKRENDLINVYYKGKLQNFHREDIKPGYIKNRGALIRKRLYDLSDSCINGFLFNELTDSCYQNLIYIPEIIEHILSYIGALEIENKFKSSTIGLSATIVVNIDDLIIDNSSNTNLKNEKSDIILDDVIYYLKNYPCLHNPCMRLYDFKNVENDEILSLKRIR